VDLQILYGEVKKEEELLYTKSIDKISTDIKTNCHKMLDQLGFVRNTIYKRDCEYTIDYITKFYRWGKSVDIWKGERYSPEEISIVIVYITLKHNKAKYDESCLLKLYDFDLMEYIKLYKKLNRWCKKNYWKK